MGHRYSEVMIGVIMISMAMGWVPLLSPRQAVLGLPMSRVGVSNSVSADIMLRLKCAIYDAGVGPRRHQGVLAQERTS